MKSVHELVQEAFDASAPLPADVCGEFLRPYLWFRCVLRKGHYGAHSMTPEGCHVEAVEQDDGPFHVLVCDACGMRDPDYNPEFHAQICTAHSASESTK